MRRGIFLSMERTGSNLTFTSLVTVSCTMLVGTQLKGGKAGISAREIARLKKAAENATVNWLIAEYDGALQFLPDDPA